MNLNPKIDKLLKALEFRGDIYLLSNEQIYSTKLKKIILVMKLSRVISVEKYNELFPEKPKNPKKQKTVRYEIFKTFSKKELLFKLIEEYKGGDKNE